ncbi:DUF2642 domain-containing protein [Bacillus sp. 1P10SD]|uniref:DUF2642 domain-containing protein n=1 Tax=Bacillus sp. 1P10SD TaxID=3132265 RepID=UPI0039A42769
MNNFQELVGKNIEIEISGGHILKGILIDFGLDIIVIYVGRNQSFLYIPVVHIQRWKQTMIVEDEVYTLPSEKPIKAESPTISFRKILTNAKGRFVEVYVSGNISIHGYVTSIMNDYLVFNSPVYKSMFISMNHVKWLIPYPEKATPYLQNNQSLLVNSTSVSLARSFVEQCKKIMNQFVIIDGGGNEEKIGFLQEVHNNQLTLMTAKGDNVYHNLEHVKTLHLP